MRRNGFEFRIDLQPRQVFDDRLVQIEFAFVSQLHQRERDERFRDRSDFKHCLRLDACLRFRVCKSIGRDPNQPLAIRERERHSRRAGLAHVPRNVFIEARKQRLHRG